MIPGIKHSFPSGSWKSITCHFTSDQFLGLNGSFSIQLPSHAAVSHKMPDNELKKKRIVCQTGHSPQHDILFKILLLRGSLVAKASFQGYGDSDWCCVERRIGFEFRTPSDCHTVSRILPTLQSDLKFWVMTSASTGSFSRWQNVIVYEFIFRDLFGGRSYFENIQCSYSWQDFQLSWSGNHSEESPPERVCIQ